MTQDSKEHISFKNILSDTDLQLFLSFLSRADRPHVGKEKPHYQPVLQ